MKENKGITLIALIITIIVMLILVAVTVSVVIKSDLIGTADGAVGDKQQAAANERTYGMNVTIKDKNYVSVGDYVEGDYVEGDYVEGEQIAFTIDSVTYTAKKGDTWADFDFAGKFEGASNYENVIECPIWMRSDTTPITIYYLCVKGVQVKQQWTDVIDDGCEYEWTQDWEWSPILPNPEE